MRRSFHLLLIAFCAAVLLHCHAALSRDTALALPANTTPSASSTAMTKVVLPARRPAPSTAEDDDFPAVDIDETIPLPPYPDKAVVAIGKLQTYTVDEEDTLLDISRHYRLGFIELRAANPQVDPWTPIPGEPVTIPSFKLLPRTAQKGIVVNLAQMRMYYFSKSHKHLVTFPIGVGREGLQTPTGDTTVIRKTAGPVWFPTERMREEKPFLPAAVPAGPSNPLGTHALYLGWPTFLIHGSNKPWAIGRRVSSGCMRMYPEDIKDIFNMVPVGTPVTVVDQPLLVGWVGDTLYLEANPSKTQGNDIEINGEHAIKPLTNAIKKVIVDAAGVQADIIDWDTVRTILEERRGYPVAIASAKTPPEKEKNQSSLISYKPVYN
ncbi:MAG: L,D-transpeptidase family protein [Proteobacteria bacterium]|nr:L,D-transpeptidase family protein [Pseudomonadota bacterium]